MLRRLLFVAFWSILKGLITAQLKNSLKDVGVKAPQLGQSLNMGNGLVMLQTANTKYSDTMIFYDHPLNDNGKERLCYKEVWFEIIKRFGAVFT